MVTSTAMLFEAYSYHVMRNLASHVGGIICTAGALTMRLTPTWVAMSWYWWLSISGNNVEVFYLGCEGLSTARFGTRCVSTNCGNGCGIAAAPGEFHGGHYSPLMGSTTSKTSSGKDLANGKPAVVLAPPRRSASSLGWKFREWLFSFLDLLVNDIAVHLHRWGRGNGAPPHVGLGARGGRHGMSYATPTALTPAPDCMAHPQVGCIDSVNTTYNRMVFQGLVP